MARHLLTQIILQGSINFEFLFHGYVRGLFFHSDIQSGLVFPGHVCICFSITATSVTALICTERENMFLSRVDIFPPMFLFCFLR